MSQGKVDNGCMSGFGQILSGVTHAEILELQTNQQSVSLKRKIRLDDVAELCVLRIDELVQEKGNSSALAMELRLSCTDPPI